MYFMLFFFERWKIENLLMTCAHSNQPKIPKCPQGRSYCVTENFLGKVLENPEIVQ